MKGGNDVLRTVSPELFGARFLHAGIGGGRIVVDPQRDVDIYLKAAEQHGVQIEHIFETHLHANFVSGHLRIAD